VEQAVQSASATLDGVEVNTDIQYDGEIDCARSLVVQVVVNLIENAAHACGPGGHIDVVARKDNGELTIEVSDDGDGIAPELRERIFEPFFTTKPPGKGTGLGLTLSRASIQRHGGDLRVAEGNPGAVFRVTLPLEHRPALPGHESSACA
jgi:signal transduction histidine kinase